MSENNNIIKNDLNENDDFKIIRNPYFKKEINYQEVFRTQLREMEKLGLYDIKKNISVLILANGDLNNAVSLLFEE